MSAKRMIQKFQNIAAQTDEKLRKNPFSENYEPEHFDVHAKDYGRPPPGSLTEKRGIRAGAYILNQVVILCEAIAKYGTGPENRRTINFGPLFKIYETYSDKVVGLLIRARKHGLLTFNGEMLYQRQDDHKPITLLMSIREIRMNVQFSNDPASIC
ncbi:Actin-binding Rho-activating protein [Aphelenchoides besseyi]|nr:Actin-binding Rho-activating protein [Aphelenchoides besseyi]KAI6201234.1 Actin-binding Rho-activating protein [Aphelenchoides besseyi]